MMHVTFNQKWITTVKEAEAENALIIVENDKLGWSAPARTQVITWEAAKAIAEFVKEFEKKG